MKEMVEAIRKFHRQNRLREQGGEDMLHRMNLIMEEVGEICQCLTKGKPRAQLIEEHADLFILLIGNSISLDFDLEEAFWEKYRRIMKRRGKLVHGTIRVTET